MASHQPDRPLKVLFLCSATSWGGNEKWALAAASGLAGRGHEVLFGVRTPMFEERAPNSKIRFVRYPFAGDYDLRTLFRLMRVIRRERIDVVLPTKRREYLLSGLAALPYRRVRTVARLGIDRPIRGFRSRLSFNRLFDGVIVNSRRIVDALSQTRGFDPSICRVVYNGIEPPVFDLDARTRIRRELGLSNEDFMLLGVGRLTPQKGFDLAIESLARMASPAQLVLAGEGSAEADYRALADRLGVAGRVRFIGFRTDVPALLQAADLFLLPSRSEGMPNALLEAMAAGRASVAFDVAGVSELMRDGEHGFIVPIGNLDALAARSEELMADPSRRTAMEAAARTRALQDFSPERMVDGVERFLYEVAAFVAKG